MVYSLYVFVILFLGRRIISGGNRAFHELCDSKKDHAQIEQ